MLQNIAILITVEQNIVTVNDILFADIFKNEIQI